MTNWYTISSKIIHSNPFFDLKENEFQRSDGKEGTYWIVKRPHQAVFIVPIAQDGKIYLIKQFRYPTQSWSWEVPAGSTDGEENLTAAKRELQEETGLIAKNWTYIGKHFITPGLTTSVGNVYIAKELAQSGHNEQEEEGIVAMGKFSINEIKEMILVGDIVDGPTLAVLARVFWVNE